MGYFHRSVKASDKLRSIQLQIGTPQHKLINEVDTRWNSTFYMFERIIEQHSPVTTALCLLDRKDLCLTTENIEFVKKQYNY